MEEDPGYPIWKDKSLERFIYDFVCRNMHTLADTFAKEANFDTNDVKISSEDVPLLTDWWSIIYKECERALAIEKDQKSNIASISSWMKNVGSGEEKLWLIPLRRAPEDPTELRNGQNELRDLLQKSNIASISSRMKNLGYAKEKFRLIPLRRAPEDPTELRNVQNELRALIQKSNISSISSWMKNLGSGEEKFRLIPLRSAPEDPMELRNVQARPNEIKKAPKTNEERRKEIEVRVAAARFLQQKSDSASFGNSEGDNNNNNKSSKDSAPGSGQRAGERRKSGKRRKNGYNPICNQASTSMPKAHPPGLPVPDPFSNQASISTPNAHPPDLPVPDPFSNQASTSTSNAHPLGLLVPDHLELLKEIWPELDNNLDQSWETHPH